MEHDGRSGADLLADAEEALRTDATVEAARLFRQALSAMRRDDDAWGVFCALVGLAGVADPTRDRAAVDELQALVNDWPEPSPSLARAQLNLGLAYHRGGDHTRAQEQLSDAVAVAARSGADAQDVLAAALTHLAIVISRTDRPDAARPLLERAAEAVQSIGGAEAEGDIKRTMGATFGRLGRYDEAVEWYRDAMTTYRSGELHREVARTTIGLAMAESSRGDHRQAIQLLNGAEPELEGDHEALAQLAMNRGNVELALGHYEAALEAYRSAEARWARLPGTELDGARARANSASVYRCMGQFRRALQLLDEAAVVYDAHATGVRGIGPMNNRAALLYDWVATQPEDAPADAMHEALRLAVRAADLCERERYRLHDPADRYGVFSATFADVYRNLIRVAAGSSENDLAASAIESTRGHAVRSSAEASEPPAMRWVGRPLPVAARPGGRTVGEPIDGISLASLADALAPSSSARWLGCAVLGRRAHVALVDHDQARVTISPFDPAWTDGFQACLPLPSRWERQVASGEPPVPLLRLMDWRVSSTALGRDARRAVRLAAALPGDVVAAASSIPEVAIAANASLDELLWPLAEALLPADLRAELLQRAHAGERTSLVIAADPATGRVPWALLPLEPPDKDRQDPLRLIDGAQIVHAPPAALCAALRARPKPAGFQAGALWVRNPTGDMGAAETVELPPDTEALDGSAATVDALTSRLRGHRYRSLVITGHVRGGRAGEPSTQGLVLAPASESAEPGVLDAEQVVAGSVPFPRQVLLLGCDSLGVAALEWTGIAAAMMWMGAEEIVATSWPIPEHPAVHRLDARLVTSVSRHGAAQGVDIELRRRLAEHRATTPDRRIGFLRWGGIAAIGSGYASGSPRP